MSYMLVLTSNVVRFHSQKGLFHCRVHGRGMLFIFSFALSNYKWDPRGTFVMAR